MKTNFLKTILLIFVACAVCQTVIFAQTNEAAPASDQPLLIPRKEVAAVQAELQRRGYYRNSPHGILDTQTRESIIEFQKENELADSGTIDLTLLNSLELKYPATGKEVESARKKGLLPRMGYGVKDGATTAKDATVNAGKTAVRSTEKAYDASTKAVKNAADVTKDKSVKLAKDAGGMTVRGARKAGDVTSDSTKKAGSATVRAGRKVNDVFVGRSDAEIQSDIREVLEANENTKRVRSEVKDGTVRLSAKSDLDLSEAVSKVRQVSGVKGVIVAAK
jgi:Putative peptidoglycan binding domain